MFYKAYDIFLYVVHVVECWSEVFVVVVGADTIQVCVVYPNRSFALGLGCITDKNIIAVKYCV